ncbi:MAG: hypothetical protein JNK14_04540 [Chitinophagaceae bacterium]|nr:hypothetical protein [Chitinophagaceae bacterium]
MRSFIKQFFVLITCGLGGCISANFNPKDPKTYIIQEYKLDEFNTLFWFERSDELMHMGMNYFQIAKNRCEVSTDSANAQCYHPLEIFKVQNDTIFILSSNDVIPINKSRYTLVQMDSVHLFKSQKRPVESQKYRLDSLCTQ